jgi:xanthine dehydrogenase iron-sulfur cluster and FAD-binding subunit A
LGARLQRTTHRFRITMQSGMSGNVDAAAVSQSLVFSINGQRFELQSGSFDPAQTVSSFIRESTRFNASTKLSCAEGGCGSCSVMGSWQRTSSTHQDARSDNVTPEGVIHRSFNACLRPLALCDGMAITTTQGLMNQKANGSKYHRVQECVARNNGSQCGFCTPGMVMALYSYLVAHPDAAETANAEAKIEQALDGNLCRCTGYRPLLASAHELVRPNEEKMEPCFPVTQEFKTRASMMLHLRGPSEQQWIRPVHLHQLRVLLKHYDGVPVNIVNGHTSVGVARSMHAIGNVHTYDSLLPMSAKHGQVNVDISRVNELCITGTLEDDQGHVSVSVTRVVDSASSQSLALASRVVFGSAISMTDIKLDLERLVEHMPQAKTEAFRMIAKHLARVAGQHVRNVGSWAGGLILARDRNFPSDLAVVLCAAGASVGVLDVSKKDSASDDHELEWRSIEDFIASPSPNSSNACVVVALRIPFSQSNRRFVTSFKSALRHQNSHALVNAAFSCDVDFITGVVSKARVVYGALSATRPLLRCTDTEAALNGVPLGALGEGLLAAGMNALANHVVPLLEAEPNYITVAQPESKVAFRRSLVMVFFYKFYVGLLFRFRRRVMDPRLFSARGEPEREAMQATQLYDKPDPGMSPIGEPIPKLAALLQASGQAKYVGDMLPSVGGVSLTAPSASSNHNNGDEMTESWWAQQPVLHGVLVCNDVAATGTLTCIDTSVALSLPGVVRVITAADIGTGATVAGSGGVNNVTLPGSMSATGKPQLPEPLFVRVGEKVSYMGQPVALAVATSLRLAEDAAASVRVQVSGNCNRQMASSTPSTGAVDTDVEEPAFCLQDAIRLNRYYAVPGLVDHLSSGDVESGLKASARRASFTLESGSMVHFPMEKQSSIAIPDEDRIVMHCSTQAPGMIRSMLINVLGVSPSKVTVTTRRAGGAFGGKGSRAAIPAASAALAALVLGVPVSVCLGIYAEHSMSGARLNTNTQVSLRSIEVDLDSYKIEHPKGDVLGVGSCQWW